MEPQAPNLDRKDGRSGSGISLQTVIIASLASAAASLAASRIWGAGTLISAAATPVVVALVSEFLRRPVQTVAATAKKVPTVQPLPSARRRTTAAPEGPTPVDGNPATADEPRARSGQTRPRGRVEPPAAITPNVDPGTIKYYGIWRPRWRAAFVTGLVAFAIVVALYTVPDILAGRSITGNGEPTTFFGGSSNVKKTTGPTTTAATTTPTTTAAKTAPTTTTTTPTTTTTGATSTSNTTTPTSTPSTTTPTTRTTPPAVNPTTTPTTPAP